MMDRRRTTSHLMRTLFESGVVSGLTDAELLDRFVRGTGGDDQQAFEVLLLRHGGMVLSICSGVLADAHDAEDAFQATFLILAQRARSIRNPRSLASWLHGVALRVSACARDARARRRRHEGRYASSCQSSRTLLGDAEARGFLHQELERLPERYRAPLLLCDMLGLTHEAAATQLGCPVGTVKSRLSRARERLRTRLVRRGISRDDLGMAPLVMGPPARSAQALCAETARLAASIASRFGPAVEMPAGVNLLMKTEIPGMSMIKLSAAVLSVVAGLAAGGTLLNATLRGPAEGQGPPQAVVVQETAHYEPAPDQDEPDGQLPPGLTRPKPWETVVRLRIVLEPSELAFGSGVVVQSDDQQTLIATCAHFFRRRHADGVPDAIDQTTSIKVDMFNVKMPPSNKRAVVTPSGEVFNGELRAVAADADLALVAIRPGRRLPASPIAPADRKIERGQTLVTAGCSNGSDASVWLTNVIDPLRRVMLVNGLGASDFIECRHVPKPGRSGGGLFNEEGELVGICNYRSVVDDAGLYAPASALHKLLNRLDQPEGRLAGAAGRSRAIFVAAPGMEGLSKQDSLVVTEAVQKALRESGGHRVVAAPEDADVVLELRAKIRDRGKPKE